MPMLGRRQEPIIEECFVDEDLHKTMRGYGEGRKNDHHANSMNEAL
jgi:hypothetical protein